MGRIFIFSVIIFLSVSCGFNGKKKLFRLLDSKSTGITFSNTLEETHQMNVIEYQDFYSGGGVAIGDIDNDGLSDIIFTGNQVGIVAYKNLGGMKFEDITKNSGLSGLGRGWFTGICMADINNDGFLDFYVSKSGMEVPEDRANLLFINNGDGSFTDKAKQYGVGHQGFAVNVAFIDYDRDGDLDMYLVNQGPIKLNSGNALELRAERHPEAGDVLYENQGDKFVDVTSQSGLNSSVIGFAHGAAVGDINNDGWDDIFVSNDFFEYDYLYINNRDKTFTETIKDATKHISFYSMGNDMADFNNDGQQDIVVLDMIAEDNRRLYSNLQGLNMIRFRTQLEHELHYQYMYNVIHRNNGNGTFSDIGTLAGISKTDWSWAPVFADFDNDGWKDLYITNGIRKDIRNIDWGQLYHNTMSLSGGGNNFSSGQWDMILNMMPSEPITNYMFRNNGDLTFSKVMDDWGMDEKSWSNGVAYGDLDNDGDLDLVVNNIDREAFIYENTQKVKNTIRFSFEGPDTNRLGIGTKVTITHNGNQQFQQHFLSRGYRSSMEPVMHFGIGLDTLVDEISVIWPDGKVGVYHNVSANQVFQCNYSDAIVEESSNSGNELKKPVLFQDVTDSVVLHFSKHEENEMEDFYREPMMPWKLSALGPAITTGDINGDGNDDIFIGGAFRRAATILVSNETGGYEESSTLLWQEERMFEDIGAAFFDLENDGDLDLYVVSGGNENTTENTLLFHRLYLNDGLGNFTKSEGKMPMVNMSGSVVVPSDFDMDGDRDLFVGGRQVPAKYPQPADSYILRNNGGVLEDVTDTQAPSLRQLGMVTDAVWADIDGDDDADLIAVGEWMPVTIFLNDGGILTKVENTDNGLQYSDGWWQSIKSSDMDGDGDVDFILGNMGLNYKFKASNNAPLELYYGDFNTNDKLDIAMGYHENGKLFPVYEFNQAVQQAPDIKDIIKNNNQYAVSTLEEIYGATVIANSTKLQAYTLSTSILWNQGNGKFKLLPMQNEVQVSAINSILIQDLDMDGKDDLLLAGNFYPMEVRTIRNDAGIGAFLKGDGKGDFRFVPNRNTGLYISGDVRHMDVLNNSGETLIVVVKNDGHPQVIKLMATNSSL